MFSLFRRKIFPEALTFNVRVAKFWEWFAEVGPRFYAAIEAGKCGDLSGETSAKVDELLPGFAWVYGPGGGGGGHSLTLSGEGNEHMQLLAIQWRAQAPVIPGWTFHASRQAGSIKGQAIEIDGLRIETREIWVAATVNVESEKIDLTVWHPAWEKIKEGQRWTIVFLFLDEALGEYGTQWWIGEILMGQDRLAESFPLEELAGYVEEASRKYGWKKHPPGEVWRVLKVQEAGGNFPRSDLFVLTTAASRLFRDYMEAEGEFRDPFPGLGADYLYVSITRDFFPEGGEANKRGEIEDALDSALKEGDSGRCLGGGMAPERAYVDLLVFDGEKSLKIVQKTLRILGLPRGTMIEFFVREKRARRIAL